MNIDAFDPTQSDLARDPFKLARYVTLLEAALGHAAQVVGILEIGSFAKEKAVPTSDIDTRVYVTSPKAYLMNLAVANDQGPPLFAEFTRLHPPLSCQEYPWWTFNEAVMAEISAALPANIEFGFVDQRYAAYELSRLAEFPSFEHSLLLQSNILYDPIGFLQQQRNQMDGQIFTPLVEQYQRQFLDGLSQRLYACLQPDAFDQFKLAKSGQIQWVQQAVRCLRNAVAAKTYITTGKFVYKKADILTFYAHHLPDDLAFVEQIYAWKTDPVIRVRMGEEFVCNPAQLYARFRTAMPQIEAIVTKIKLLDLAIDPCDLVITIDNACRL